MKAYLFIALGSALGGCARYALAMAVGAQGFPWGTLAVNVLGCLAIGLLAAKVADPELRQFLMTGFCGGFTTFSSFGLETLQLLRDGQTLAAGAYVAASVVVCLLAVWCGYSLLSRF